MAKYLGKILRVTSKVSGVSEFNIGTQYIFTLTGTPEIHCVASAEGRKANKALSTGQDVTSFGRCTDATADRLRLSDWSVVKAGDDPAVNASAEDLATGLIHIVFIRDRHSDAGLLEAQCIGNSLAGDFGGLARRVPTPVDLDIQLNHGNDSLAHSIAAETLWYAVNKPLPTVEIKT